MIIRALIGTALLALLAAGGYLYQYGKPRVARDTMAFANALKACAPLEQDYWSADLGRTMKRSVGGENDGLCAISWEALGAGALLCDLPPDEAVILADGVVAQLKDISLLGRATAFRYSSENPDPMTAVMNGPHCRVEQ